MQLPVRCSRRIFLAVCVILFVGCTVQGAPAHRARYKRVRCRPDAWSPNCVEEMGPRFQLPDDAANRILPPLANPALMKRYQELGDIFPLSEEQSGSGWEPALEPGSGSGAEAVPAIRSAHRPDLPAGLGQRLQEEALLP
ncbi:serglycin [Lagopus muta]|uniref:serglycin n=1 Tax=Lagopus leucura TaxID=30410 RepID=UPI001C6715D2|nr:serglycin [Lagopus leucura]XP_048801564.1 serglycin [Lagopus muta]